MAGPRALPLEGYPPFVRSATQLVHEANIAIETFKGVMLGHNWELVQAESGRLAGVADLLLRRLQTLTDLYA